MESVTAFLIVGLVSLYFGGKWWSKYTKEYIEDELSDAGYICSSETDYFKLFVSDWKIEFEKEHSSYSVEGCVSSKSNHPTDRGPSVKVTVKPKEGTSPRDLGITHGYYNMSVSRRNFREDLKKCIDKALYSTLREGPFSIRNTGIEGKIRERTIEKKLNEITLEELINDVESYQGSENKDFRLYHEYRSPFLEKDLDGYIYLDSEKYRSLIEREKARQSMEGENE